MGEYWIELIEDSWSIQDAMKLYAAILRADAI